MNDLMNQNKSLEPINFLFLLKHICYLTEISFYSILYVCILFFTFIYEELGIKTTKILSQEF